MAALFAGLVTNVLPAWAATSSADSNIITVDTRGTQSGTLTGLVQGNGTPLANAQVRIDSTPFTASTAANGKFTLATVPAGSGYLLKVSAAGFASKSVPGITATAGTTDLGTITLGTTTGPYQIIPLAPDVNPATTTVEQGGAAYRYYLMQNSAGQPQGGVAVSVQVVGGSPIPQAQDVSSFWPGQIAGTSDADGIVRIAIPSSALGAPEDNPDNPAQPGRPGAADVPGAGHPRLLRPGLEAEARRRGQRRGSAVGFCGRRYVGTK
jgi:hypothetical protein